MSFEPLRHHWQIAVHAWRNRRQMDGEARNAHELEFLPAALEVQESPPSPAGRAVVWSIITFFCLALLWTIFGNVDIVAIANGKIIPAGKSKVIQPMEIGVVKTIHVEEDQRVKAGDLLIDLDPTMANADMERYQTELMTAKVRLLRVETIPEIIDNNIPVDHVHIEAPEGLPAKLVQKQQALLQDQIREYRARINALDAEIGKTKAEARAIAEDLIRVESLIPIVNERVDSLKRLAAKQLVARNDYLQLEQERIEQVQNREVLRNRATEVAQAIRQAQAETETVQAEFHKNLAMERAELEDRISALETELLKATTRSGLQQLTAPVDGVVQQLAVHTIGGVVTPAQSLMIIVPEGMTLEVEAYLENKDIGFVEEGQVAEVKVDAFPFTKYGTIDGKVAKISNDAIDDEERGWVFSALVSMERDWIDVNHKRITLSPGMSVSVEVKTGTRRLIEYFLSPVLEGLDESVRER